MASRTTKRIPAKYWGYFLIPLLFLGWFYFGLDPLMLGVLSSLAVFYALFQAPVPCSAITRDGYFCRHNAKGYCVAGTYNSTSGRI